MADKKNIQDELRQMTDPIAYRDNPQSGYDKYIEGWDASKLQNADVNISQYGDDSSAANYNNQSLWGGENQKYTGENTLGSQVVYNPNATLEGLNPDYKYGQAAQMQNSVEANYIASRNDEIASALYNAGKTSIQDVNDFLSTQTGWDYSNANERANTVASVWKRIGQIASQQGQQDQPKPERETIKSEDTSGKIYGKATADSGEPTEGIDTLSDANNIYNMGLASRQANLDTLYNMSTDVIAAARVSNTFSFGEQAWIDYQRAYPQLYAEVQRKEKELRGQMTVDAITTGSENNSSVVDTTNTTSNLVSYATSNATTTTSATQLLQSIDSILESNDTAKSAQELMGSIENDMAKLKNRMKNLRKEANEVFRGDAPDYLVNAYINNKSQEIQNQMSILEDRYNAAYTRYQTELAHSEFEAELQLKKDSLELEKSKALIGGEGATTTTTTNKNYSVAERNNNPTNMTVDFLKMMGAEAGVDYEVSDDYFINGKGNRQYYGILIGDPIERTISILDKAVANGRTPFTVTSWSYINKLGLTNEKWKSMSHDEKVDKINEWLVYEGGNMENMAYYLEQDEKGGTNEGEKKEYGINKITYDTPGVRDLLEKFLSGDWSGTRPEKTASDLGLTDQEFGQLALDYAAAQKEGYNAYSKERGVDETLGYIPDKGEIYATIVSSKYKIAGTQQEMILKSLNLDPKDPNAWDIATTEASKYMKDQQNNDDALGLIDAMEYLIMQDANKVQRMAAMSDGKVGKWDRFLFGEAADWKTQYLFIKDNLSLDHLQELKRNGATFGALSNQELDVIGSAAAALSPDMSNEEFHHTINRIYNLLRKNAGYEMLDEATLDGMWNAEQLIGGNGNDFSNYIVRNHARLSLPFGLGWKYGNNAGSNTTKSSNNNSNNGNAGRTYSSNSGSGSTVSTAGTGTNNGINIPAGSGSQAKTAEDKTNSLLSS